VAATKHAYHAAATLTIHAVAQVAVAAQLIVESAWAPTACIAEALNTCHAVTALVVIDSHAKSVAPVAVDAQTNVTVMRTAVQP